jgi:nucleotide-binding universal stress UspA family protein
MTGFTMRSLLPDLLQFYARACDVVQDVSACRVSGAAPEPVARARSRNDHAGRVRGIALKLRITVGTQHKCDLIVMASHGRRGVRALLLGCETQKVLTHSDIPVLVVRRP